MKIERVDDIPLIIAELEKCKLSDALNEFFPDHGNWKGLSGGQVTVGFLTYILSCADHRLSHVEPWALGRLHVLGHCLNYPELVPEDFSDDRLGAILDRFSESKQWDSFESRINRSLIRVHKLPVAGQAIRLDACIIQSFRKESGLFQLGYSKQHRSDLPQLKAMVATLDPLSMPLAVEVVSGEKADDPLYIPVIDKVNKSLDMDGLFYVGDAKLGTLGNRAYIQKEGHYYLCPLGKGQCSNKELKAYLKQKPQTAAKGLFRIFDGASEQKLIAMGFEMNKNVSSSTDNLEWKERRIVVHSTAWAKTQHEKLEKRLTKAATQLGEILVRKQRKRIPKTLEDVQIKIAQILGKHKVASFFEINIEQVITKTPLRKYGNKPERIQENITFKIEVTRKDEVIKDHQTMLGWRAYATNIPKEKLSTMQAVLCYREEYKIEHKFNQLLNKVTALIPVFLKKDHRVVALTKLLLLALKFVSLIQHQVRGVLKQTGQYVKELFPGNPGRKTNQPTTEMLLRAFKDISIVILPIEDTFTVKLVKLKPIQLKILNWLDIPPDVFLSLERISFFNVNFIET